MISHRGQSREVYHVSVTSIYAAFNDNGCDTRRCCYVMLMMLCDIDLRNHLDGIFLYI
jgi:hypothetical protein